MNRFLAPLIVLIVTATLYLCWIALTPAHAHSWYDASCCHDRDCERISFDAVMEVEGGWMIDFVSERFGAVREFFPASEARDSQDGSFHVCFYYTPMPSGKRLRCLYRPVNS